MASINKRKKAVNSYCNGSLKRKMFIMFFKLRIILDLQILIQLI